jgi:hypothetical protein
MSHLPGWFSLVVGIIALVLMAAAVAGLAWRARRAIGRGSSLVDREGSSSSRNDLLRRGLRLQATITDVRSPRTLFPVGQNRQQTATTATGFDPDTGLPRRFTQRSDRPLGRRGDPVTVLIDPARPRVYLIVR